MNSSALPFTVRVLDDIHSSSLNPDSYDLWAGLPASTRAGHARDKIVVPERNVNFLERELSVKRINDVQEWLWVCGRPMPPRPLHYHALHSRNIAISEDMGLHLVWQNNRIFLKPIPLYLLNPDFWAEHLVTIEKEQGQRRQLAEYALGFLFSYTALIAYRSDFNIAKESGLLHKDIEWEAWQTLTAQLIETSTYADITPRFWYGELRLSRLNTVYKLRKGAIFRGYSRVGAHTAYEDLLQDNFALLTTILGSFVIFLTAMQVGLGVDRLRESEAFQAASYGFTVFSMVAPLAFAGLIFLFVLLMFISNWQETKRYERKRFSEMGVKAFRKRGS
jgi:hypothetical protein